MCLTIDKTEHTETMRYGNYKKLPKPLIADKDIPCHKFLKYVRNHDYYTPYIVAKVEFNEDGIAILESDLKGKKKYPFGYKYCSFDKEHYIYEGIHSYCNNIICFVNHICFNAIIPKGSMYYYGDDNDLVSDTLIVFKTKEDYQKYCEKSNMA